MKPEHHFLDANILVGFTVTWDLQYESVARYMTRESVKRHTSKRVYRESRGVLEGSRRLILKYLREFYKKVSRALDPLKIDRSIRNFTKQFSSNLVEKERKIIESFVNRNFNELKNVALGGEETLGEFKKSVGDTFLKALDYIDIHCKPDDPEALICRYDNCPENYKPHYPDKCSTLCSVINYKNDVLVLLDSYFIKNNHIRENICFVTTDQKHLLKNKPVIERILTGISLLQPK